MTGGVRVGSAFMSSIALGRALRLARNANPASMPTILATAAAEFGATDLVVYLVDFGQEVLQPMPDRSGEPSSLGPEAIATTMAGRAFTDQNIHVAERDDGVRLWIPVLEGSDHAGVIALTLPRADERIIETCAALGDLAGYLIAAHARCTDLYHVYRRQRSMTLAASMQWDLLPPLVLKASGISIAGLLEPAYNIGGDCFDYSLNGAFLDIAIVDAVGRGLDAARLGSLTIGSYRHDRRDGHSLTTMHNNLESLIAGQYDDCSFATGLLGRLGLDNGVFSWTNAGHPPPLLIRQGHVVGELRCDPTPPWGVGNREPSVRRDQLEPGDCLLLYTDGITEARTLSGDLFGVDRLIDFMNRHAAESLRPEEMLRKLVANVREYQGIDDLGDDATAVLVRWDGTNID